MAPLTAFASKMRTKQRNPLSSAGGGLAPMTSMAAELQPSVPAVNFFGVGGGGAGMSPIAGQLATLNSMSTGGTKPKDSYSSMSDWSRDAEKFGPEMFRRNSPLPGAGAGGAALPAQIDPAEYIDVLKRSPSAMANLPPAVAAVLQEYGEGQANTAAQGRAREAIEGVTSTPTTGPAAAPDVEGIFDTRMSPRYWASRTRQAEGETSAQFDRQTAAIDEQLRAGAPKEWGRIAKAQLEMQKQQALSSTRAQLKNRQEELEAQMDMEYANQLMNRYRTAGPMEQRGQMAGADILTNFPDRTTPWTGLEGYQRGARMDELAALAPLRSTGGGGGGSSSFSMLPAGDPGWDFGAVPVGSAAVSEGNYFGADAKKKKIGGMFADLF